MLKLAIQKSGRLHEDSVQLLKDCGIPIRSSKDQLKCRVENFPLEIFFLRDDDIPQYVADGVAHIGIVGQNVLIEKGKALETVQTLGFGKCRLSIAVGKDQTYTPRFLDGKRIATSYPRITQQYLDREGLDCEIHEISGSVELAPGIGLADAVCDLVSTGSTLFMNGLKEVEAILKSEAVLVAHDSLPPDATETLDRLLFRIRAVLKAKDNKYVLLNAPNEALDNIIALLPGMRSPTVLPLAQSGWSSVHSVIAEEDFWANIQSLKEAGAEGILVIPIQKMIV